MKRIIMITFIVMSLFIYSEEINASTIICKYNRVIATGLTGTIDLTYDYTQKTLDIKTNFYVESGTTNTYKTKHNTDYMTNGDYILDFGTETNQKCPNIYQFTSTINSTKSRTLIWCPAKKTGIYNCNDATLLETIKENVEPEETIVDSGNGYYACNYIVKDSAGVLWLDITYKYDSKTPSVQRIFNDGKSGPGLEAWAYVLDGTASTDFNNAAQNVIKNNGTLTECPKINWEIKDSRIYTGFGTDKLNYTSGTLSDISNNNNNNNNGGNTPGGQGPDVDIDITEGCGLISDELREWLNGLLNVIKIGAIAVTIVLTMLDFAKGAAIGEADEMKKLWKRLVRRLIIIVLLFIIPIIIDFILKMVSIIGVDPNDPTCGLK